MDHDSEESEFDNPLDNRWSAGPRLAIELAAWVAGPWAAAELFGTWIAIVPALVVLVGLPVVFSTPGDKRHVIVAVNGTVRLQIELTLAIVAIYSAFLVWTPVGGGLVSAIAVLTLTTGFRRTRWLLSNSPPDWPLPSDPSNRK